MTITVEQIPEEAVINYDLALNRKIIIQCTTKEFGYLSHCILQHALDIDANELVGNLMKSSQTHPDEHIDEMMKKIANINPSLSVSSILTSIINYYVQEGRRIREITKR